MEKVKLEQIKTGLPWGVVTFLLTDIEGSTRLWESSRDEMGAAVRRHHDLLSESIEAHRGIRPRDQGEGDSLLAVFQRASDAATCAVAIQGALSNEIWPPGVEIRVRMSIHSGEPDLRDQHNYMGTVINRAARIRALAAGGQILVSEPSAALLDESLPPGAQLRNLGTFTLRDLSRREKIFELRYQGVREFPPPLGVESALNNMPAWLSNFIDRPDEEAEISRCLKDSRLVTVAGPGGCGKTRLALHVASKRTEDFADGVWIVDLAPVVEYGLLIHRVALGLGVLGAGAEEALAKDRAATPELAEMVTTFLKKRDLLLVLDNCEHLVEPVADLIENLVVTCPALKILVTTREVLGLPGEMVYRVPPMSIPSPEAPLDAILEHAAVRLFVERARRVRPSFAPDAESARVISELCRRLDGLPLAIELAAAKVKVMSLAEILARLTDHFSFLTGGRRTALERQQTLQSTVDWSYKHCNQSEQTLLRRLSVFAGSCTLEAAEAVTSGQDFEASDVLHLIENLVDKSLIVADESAVETRFRMLETIRQFAREKLSGSEEASVLRDRHADFFLSLAETGDYPIHCEDEPDALIRLDADQQNLNAAVEWSLAAGNNERACRLGWALYLYWITRGLTAQPILWLREGLADAEIVSVEARAGAAAALARLAEQSGEPDTRELATMAIELADRSGNAEHEFVALLSLIGYRAFTAGSADEGREELDQLTQRLAAAAHRTGKKHLEILAETMEAWNEGDRGRIDDYIEILDRSLSVSRRIGFKRGIAMNLCSLVWDSVARDELHLAMSQAEEALGLAREIRSLPLEAEATHALANVNLARGDFAAAETAGMQALSIVERTGVEVRVVVARGFLGWVRIELGDYEGVEKDHETLLALALRHKSPFLEIFARRTLSRLALVNGHLDSAETHAQQAVDVARERAVLVLPSCLVAYAAAKALKSETSQSYELSLEAFSESVALHEWGLITSLLDVLAFVLTRRSQFEDAARLLGCADAMRSRTGRALYPSLQVFKDEATDSAEKALGNSVFMSAYNGGREAEVVSLVEGLEGAKSSKL